MLLVEEVENSKYFNFRAKVFCKCDIKKCCKNIAKINVPRNEEKIHKKKIQQKNIDKNL